MSICLNVNISSLKVCFLFPPLATSSSPFVEEIDENFRGKCQFQLGFSRYEQSVQGT